jgi:cell wall assembly regulator SMI1
MGSADGQRSMCRGRRGRRRGPSGSVRWCTLGGVVSEGVERVRRAWAGVLAWCEVNAPVTAAVVRGPAGEGALTEAQAAMGLSWPEELVAWLRMSDGAGCSLDALVLPTAFVPSGVKQIVDDWNLLTSYPIPAEEVLAAATQPAGTDCLGFLPCWIPIAANFCGGYLFVDLRSGPRHGSIGEWHTDGGSDLGPIWDDIAHMLETVVSALRAGHAGDWDPDIKPTVDNGRLTWLDSR